VQDVQKGQEESERRGWETKKINSTQINLNKTSSGNPRCTSNQSSKPCTVLQYPSRKARVCSRAFFCVPRFVCTHEFTVTPCAHTYLTHTSTQTYDSALMPHYFSRTLSATAAASLCASSSAVTTYSPVLPLTATCRGSMPCCTRAVTSHSHYATQAARKVSQASSSPSAGGCPCNEYFSSLFFFSLSCTPFRALPHLYSAGRGVCRCLFPLTSSAWRAASGSCASSLVTFATVTSPLDNFSSV